MSPEAVRVALLLGMNATDAKVYRQPRADGEGSIFHHPLNALRHVSDASPLGVRHSDEG